MALSEAQKRKAREKLARKKGVSVSRISDADISSAITDGILNPAIDLAGIYGTYDSGSSSCYDSGSSSSSYDSGSSSGSCDSGSW